MPVGGAAMDEQDRRLSLAAVVDTVQLQAVNNEFALSHAIFDASIRCRQPSNKVYQSIRTNPASKPKGVWFEPASIFIDQRMVVRKSPAPTSPTSIDRNQIKRNRASAATAPSAIATWNKATLSANL
jgi:hypothetical protein